MIESYTLRALLRNVFDNTLPSLQIMHAMQKQMGIVHHTSV